LPQEAAKLYQSAMSQYRTGRNWSQARPLLEQYVRQYGTAENVPLAYLQLADCANRLKDAKGFDAALSEVIRRFYGSGYWFVAYATKLKVAREAKDREEYLRLLESMVRYSIQVPVELRPMHSQFWRHGGSGWGGYDARSLKPGGASGGGGEWVEDVLWAAETETAARRALRALSATFHRRGDDLPAAWQHAHYLLLRRTGQDKPAEKVLQDYIKSWGDNRGLIQLLTRHAEYLEARKDEQAAEAVLADIAKRFPTPEAPEEALMAEVRSAAEAGEYDKFAALAGKSLETYGLLHSREILSLWTSLAKARHATDATAMADLLKVLDRIHPDTLHAWRRAKAAKRVELHLFAGKAEQAANAAEFYLRDSEWAPATLKRLEDLAKEHQAFEPLLAKAREKYGIPLPKPEGPAAKLLEQLNTRLKDDQVRHAEEIGEELFTKHKAAAATIEGLKALVDYYFKKVLPVPRDKWMKRMIEAYTHHPLTYAVLRTQVAAAEAAKREDAALAARRALLERFPAAVGYEEQLRHMKPDAERQEALARERWGGGAARGDVRSMERLARYSEEARDKGEKGLGDFWAAQAKRFAGTKVEITCLRRALGHYNHPHRPPIWDEAAKTIEALRKQTLDPALRWRMEFADVNLLIRKRDAKAAFEALDARITGKRTYRDLSRRLDVASLGAVLATEDYARKGLDLAAKLRRCCFTTRDADAIDLMLAVLHKAVKDLPGAAGHYLSIVYRGPWPARRRAFLSDALKCLERAPAAYTAAVNKYVGAVGRAQDLIPPLLAALGSYYLKHGNAGAAAGVRGRLASSYLASRALDRLDGLLIEARKKMMQKGKR
jgi:hypothetical protein